MTDATVTPPAETQVTPPGEQTQVAAPTDVQPTPAAPAAEAPAPAPTEGNKAEQPPGAPEKYEFAAPDGVHLGDSVLSKFSEAAKAANLPQDAAQRILSEVAPAIVAEQAAALESIGKEWAEASRADKEIGGEKFDENLGIAKQAMTKFATPELTKLLVDTQLGNHPEVLRLFHRIGKAISEDKVIPGNGAPTPTANDRLAALYDKTPPSA